MPLTSATEQSIRRVFSAGFAARDIAEPLASFDATTDLSVIREFMLRRPLSVVGIRQEGLITGYLDQETLDKRPLDEQTRPLANARVLETSATLRDVILCLGEQRFAFVAVLGQPVGVLTRDDLEKAPARMWLFGMVTLIEMRLTRLIRQYLPGEEWHEFLAETRIEKARELQTERHRRNQSVDLLDCLQFGDKGLIIARSDELMSRIRMDTRRQVKRAIKGVEGLRNNLAHAQDIVVENWDMIFALASDLDRILEEPDHLQPRTSHTPYSEDAGE